MPSMSIGLILGCGLAEVKKSEGKKIDQASRLFRKLISESARMVWKIRNERVISGRNHTQTEIHNRWINCINGRLRMDQLLTD
ncbi:hypothetical protein B0H13DRAFT_1560310, partial [Mycena leptocephala]